MDKIVADIFARLDAPEPDHARFTGPPLDTAGLTGLQLGQLWPVLNRLRWNKETGQQACATAAQVLSDAQRHHLDPILDTTLCTQTLAGLPEGSLTQAVLALGYTRQIEQADDAMRAEAGRILGPAAGWERLLSSDRYQVYLLARVAGPETVASLRTQLHISHAGSPLCLLEFDTLGQVSLDALLSVAGGRNMVYWTRGSGDEDPDPVLALTHEAAYIDFAQHALEAATARVQQVHAATVPYKADALFTTDEAQVLGRAARLAALLDEPWYASLIGTLLPGVAVAPTAAKTLPSQALAIALGHAIEAVPTPEGLAALRATLQVIRHSGVEKKLARNLKPAERGLGARPDVALRMALASTPGQKPDKKRVAMLARCLEAGWYQALSIAWPVWQANLVAAAGGRELAANLIWSAADPGQDGGPARSFMLDPKSGTPCDSAGQACAIDASSQISLWHPLLAGDAERLAWQDAIARRGTAQPLRQVWREWYRPLAKELAQPESTMFARQTVSLVPLIGLARSEGWQIDKTDGLRRQFGAVRVQFQIDANLYPGARGSAETGSLFFFRRDGRHWLPVAQGDISPLVFSEAARAADLLVSVGAAAIDAAPAGASPLALVFSRGSVLTRTSPGG